jgi:SOS-response transcriptional repressor LexA
VRDITTKQRRVLEAICLHLIENRVPPTLRELMAALGYLSPNAIIGLLRPLAERRYITWRDGETSRARDIRPVGMKIEKVECLSPDGKWIYEGHRPVIDGGKKGQRLLAALATT